MSGAIAGTNSHVWYVDLGVTDTDIRYEDILVLQNEYWWYADPQIRSGWKRKNVNVTVRGVTLCYESVHSLCTKLSVTALIFYMDSCYQTPCPFSNCNSSALQCSEGKWSAIQWSAVGWGKQSCEVKRSEVKCSAGKWGGAQWRNAV